MKQTEYSVRVLEPAEGMMLTQSADVPAEKRVLSDKVYLSAKAKPEDWKEIGAREAEEFERLRREALAETIQNA